MWKLCQFGLNLFQNKLDRKELKMRESDKAKIEKIINSEFLLKLYLKLQKVLLT